MRTLQKVTPALVTETSAFTFVADASDLGFEVGVIPNSLESDLGNGGLLFYTGTDEHGIATFKQIHGCLTLRVLND